MPGFKRKQFKRKGGKRSKPRRTQALNATKSLSPLPTRFITKHKYATSFDISALTQQYNFNLNSLYDPDRTGAGHQPYGFDQFAGLYDKYRVISCSYVIQGIQPDSPGTNVRLACNPHNEAITFSDMNLMLESPRTKYVVQGAQGSPLKTLRGTVYLPSIVGRTKSEYMADDRYAAQNGLNPAELAILTVMSSTIDNSGVFTEATITLNYTVEWFDIKQQTQS